MAKINSNYLLLPNSYLFAEIAKKIKTYQEANPKADIIRMGIGDVTRPLTNAVVTAMERQQKKWLKALLSGDMDLSRDMIF